MADRPFVRVNVLFPVHTRITAYIGCFSPFKALAPQFDMKESPSNGLLVDLQANLLRQS